MKRSATSATAAILLLTMSAAAADDAALSAVAAASRAWDEAYSAADVAGLADRYDEAAVSMPPGLPALSTRAAIVADFKAFFDANRATHRTFDAERRVAGDYAIERARYEARIMPRDGGTETKESGKHVVVYRRQADGTWKVLWEIWSSDGGA